MRMRGCLSGLPPSDNRKGVAFPCSKKNGFIIFMCSPWWSVFFVYCDK